MKSSFVKKVLVIFLIGLVCRVGLNIFYDIEVFNSFYSFIGLVSYGVMICSSVVVYELPSVDFNCFNVKVIREAITEWWVNGFAKEKIMDGYSVENTKGVNSATKNIGGTDDTKGYNLLHRKSSGEYRGKTSAGVTGLYGNSGSSSGKVSAGV